MEIDARRHSLPALHPINQDVVFCLLLRKRTAAVSCAVLALATEDSGLVYSRGKYLLLLLLLRTLAKPRNNHRLPMGRRFH